MQWGAEADAKLFMHTLRIHGIKLDYVALAQAMGNDCTPKAITHRVAKLKETAKADNPSPSTGTPPKKRARPARKTPTNTPTKTPASDKQTVSGGVAEVANMIPRDTPTKIKREPVAYDYDDDENLSDEPQQPKKKVKTASAGRAASGAGLSHRTLNAAQEAVARGRFVDGLDLEEFGV